MLGWVDPEQTAHHGTVRRGLTIPYVARQDAREVICSDDLSRQTQRSTVSVEQILGRAERLEVLHIPSSHHGLGESPLRLRARTRRGGRIVRGVVPEIAHRLEPGP